MTGTRTITAPACPAAATEMANYADDWRWVIYAVTIVSLTFMLGMVILRTYGQGLVKKAFTAEFHCLLVAVASGATTAAASVVAVRHGMGLHKSRVLHDDPSAQNVIVIMEMMYVLSLFTAVALTATKSAILLFYRRLFKSHTISAIPKFNCIWNLLSYFNAVFGVMWICIYIAPCVPICLFWEQYSMLSDHPAILDVDGQCIPELPLVLVPIIIDFILELAIVLLGLASIFKTQLCGRRKLKLAFIFGLAGSISIVFGVIRSVRVVFFVVHQDQDLTDQITGMAAVWTVAHICITVGMVCLPGSMPAFKQIYDLSESLVCKVLGRKPRVTEIVLSPTEQANAERKLQARNITGLDTDYNSSGSSTAATFSPYGNSTQASFDSFENGMEY